MSDAGEGSMSSDHGSRLRDQLDALRENWGTTGFVTATFHDGRSETSCGWCGGTPETGHLDGDCEWSDMNSALTIADALLRASASAQPEQEKTVVPTPLEHKSGCRSLYENILGGLHKCNCGASSALSPDPSALREAANPPATDLKPRDSQEPNPCPKCGAFLWGDTRPCWNCARAAALASPRETEPAMLKDLRTYLDMQTITSENIGKFRRWLFLPWESQWNGWVRDETAARENKAPRLSGSSSEERGEHTKTKS